jgi:hypothetical protein
LKNQPSHPKFVDAEAEKYWHIILAHVCGGAKTLSITTFSITTLSIKGLHVTLSKNDTQHSITTLCRTTPSIMTVSLSDTYTQQKWHSAYVTLGIKGLYVTLSISSTEYKQQSA